LDRKEEEKERKREREKEAPFPSSSKEEQLSGFRHASNSRAEREMR
jgi:hypothetical protein